MSTVATERSRPLSATWLGRLRKPLPAAIVGSRLLVLAGALVGAVLPRVSSWKLADPRHVTLGFGKVGNVLAAASVRWDALHYLTIAEHGYSTRSNTVFFPLYPLLIRAFSYLTASDVVAGVAISLVTFATAMVLLHRLTCDELGTRVADATVLLLAFSPVSLFFSALYTESLFLVFALAAFMLARSGRFGWAGVAAAAATLTHIEGVFLVAPLAIFYWQQRRDQSSWRFAARATPLLTPLAALAGFCAFLHSQGYSWLAFSSNERYYKHHLTGPVTGIADGVSAGVSGLAQIVTGSAANLTSRQNAFENIVYLVVLVLSVVTLVATWTRLPKPYAVFSGLCLLTCISSPLSDGQPLTSLDRYVLVLFPLWMVAARWLQERRLLRAALTGSGTLAFMFALEFARWVFFG